MIFLNKIFIRPTPYFHRFIIIIYSKQVTYIAVRTNLNLIQSF